MRLRLPRLSSPHKMLNENEIKSVCVKQDDAARERQEATVARLTTVLTALENFEEVVRLTQTQLCLHCPHAQVEFCEFEGGATLRGCCFCAQDVHRLKQELAAVTVEREESQARLLELEEVHAHTLVCAPQTTATLQERRRG